MFASETGEAVAHSAGWFLENAWLIAVIPAAAFFVIILFGKRLPMKGAEVGVLSMASSLVLAAGTAYQWIQRVDEAHGAGEGGGHLLRPVSTLIRSAVSAEGGEEAAHHLTPYTEPVIKSWTWWQSGDLHFGIGQHIDGLAVMLLLLVAFISTLVQLYSIEYVRGDRRFTHFFASLTLFSAGMLTMVLAENMVQLILGWEIMGLCSFMLIGHWWEEQANSRAALKAFFTVRVGDVGLLVGTAILFGAAGTFSIQGLSGWATSAGESGSHHTVLFWASVALFIACIGKSGQFPLHTWLPDAMAGPTPVSSLLHSSTMVVAGVFLVARLYPVFDSGLGIAEFGGQSINLIAVIGGITIIIAAALAFVQNDIKKVLAYSTVSQLGYMMMGLGVGAWTPAVFHIFTHAFFKCCLFLCAGSVSHTASHHSFDMKKDMGGLWRRMPVTAGAWMVSTAALCGVPFFSGFFSKDEIIDNADHHGYTIFFVVGLIGAFMTTAYMTRATYLTFFGKARGAAAGEHAHDDHAVGHATHDEADVYQEGELESPQHVPAVATAHTAHGHAAGAGAHAPGHGAADEHHAPAHGKPAFGIAGESPWLIAGPLVVLGVLALVSGYLNAAPFGIHLFTEWVEPGSATHLFPVQNHAEFEWLKAVPSMLLVAAGFAVSLFVCQSVFGERRNFLTGLTTRSRPLRAGHTFLVQKYYLDHLYERVVVHAVAHPISKAAYWVNQHVIDGIVNGVGIGGRKAGTWVYEKVDQRVVDGAVNGSGAAARGAGHALQPVQSGKVSQYGALLFSAAAIGALVLVIVNT